MKALYILYIYIHTYNTHTLIRLKKKASLQALLTIANGCFLEAKHFPILPHHYLSIYLCVFCEDSNLPLAIY